MINAEFRSEERYCRLLLSYDKENEKKSLCEKVDLVIQKYAYKPEIYTTSRPNGIEILVVEYHDDCNRQAGQIFEEIIKILDITNFN